MTERTLVALLALAACDPAAFGPPQASEDAGTDPAPGVSPRPLATQLLEIDRDGGARRVRHDAGIGDAAPPPPRPYAHGELLDPDELLGRELAGATLEARWIWRDLPPEPKGRSEGWLAARDATALRWTVQLADAGRARVRFAGRALPLAAGASLLFRSDRYGAVVVWPDDARYRVLVPGSLRSLLDEQRADVTPLAPAAPIEEGVGQRLGLTTRKLRVRSAVGSARLEVADVPETGAGAPLLCRAVVEILGVDPATSACEEPELLLAAELSWNEADRDAGIAFEVTAINRGPQSDVVVPAGARRAETGLPAATSFLRADELHALRDKDGAPPTPVDPLAPADGLAAANHGERTLWLLLDAVPIVAVPPGGERRAPGLRPGRYAAQWRSFLGEAVLPASEVDLPGRIAFGQALAEPLPP